MVLKGVNWVHNAKIRSYGLERSPVGYTVIRGCQMVLKGVNWVQNNRIRLKGLERNELGTQ